MAQVKICGLKRPGEMRLCAALNVEWVGFVFYPPSPRFITPEQALRLHEAAPDAQSGGPKRVGLFVKPDIESIETVLRIIPLDVLQLYGPTEQLVAFKNHFNLPVWQAIGIKSASDLPTEKNTLDGYIIEAPADSDNPQPGGLGKCFDWKLTQNWPAPAPWLLAGGLTPENVSSALSISGAPAVDVSSGVEESRGVKSLKKIEKFVQFCR